MFYKKKISIILLLIPFLLHSSSCTTTRREKNKKTLFIKKGLRLEEKGELQKALALLERAQQFNNNTEDLLLHAKINNLKREISGLKAGINKDAQKNDNKTSEQQQIIWHVVSQGETLSMIADRFFWEPLHYKTIATLNNITDPKNISPGQKIKIPVSLIQKVKKKTVNKAKRPSSPQKNIATQTEENSTKAMNHALGLYEKEYFLDALTGFYALLGDDPENKTVIDHIKKINLILYLIEQGTIYRSENKYIKSLEIFHQINILKPESKKALKETNRSISFMISQARLFIDEKQSPCEAEYLMIKVLDKRPKDQEAKKIFKEAVALKKGLKFNCRKK